MAKPPSKGKLLYHITHINNLESIFTYGLLPRKMLKESNGLVYTDIADPDIIDERNKYQLSEYVLFHFFAKNPFDYAVAHRYSSENLAIITICRDLAKINDFKIIPSHPLDNAKPDILPYDEGLKKIKWDILDNVNRDYTNSEIRKACMAECILKYIVQPEVFEYVYVCNENVKEKVCKINNAYKIKIKVNAYMFL